MEILFTRRAEANFVAINGYIKDKFGEGTAEQFVKKDRQHIATIKDISQSRAYRKG